MANDPSGSSSGSDAAADATPTGGSDSGGLELPEGCGDGIVEPGQYCFVKVPLPYLGPDHNKVTTAAAVDVDGDGRDELVVGGITAAFLSFDDGAFEFGPPMGSGLMRYELTTRWDWDRDGHEDLLVPSYEGWRVFIVRSLGDRLADVETEVIGGSEYITYGAPVALDVDEDGQLEFLVSAEWPLLEQGAHLRKRVAGEWTDVGPILPLPGCGVTGARAQADFDEDGHLDLVVHDSVTGCDPYPTQYDPAFHRVAVFRSDPESGRLEPTGMFPTGGWGEVGMWADDFDGDGHQDVAIQIQTVDAISLLRGRGDGTLEEAELITEIGGTVGFWGLSRRGRADFDGDGDLEWMGGSENGDRWILESFLEEPSVVLLPRSTPPVMTIGDFNGDGVVDFVDSEPVNLGEKYVMLSMP
ncbi:FG-GAP repeat domain-containing protein [Paraliomyxa miuraensis]|uniref:FG-GAP repeat domain-containing protein n=1 Tax=Paraliomyxa miuraensis TaxID=376150 RepID=UPI002257F06F|nr:VCBS repeat-containing protein [Paraliomyxa miuraensis]MCX4239798.1 VCBS repeat-containing protein [Paraliomyxa miuraensis]